MQPVPTHIADILRNDVCVALAYRTPAGGVVMTPVSTLGMFDPDAGTVATTSSFGNWKKMRRMQEDDRVALVYHSRQHSSIDHPQVVVVQGRASFPDRATGSWVTPEVQRRMHEFLPDRPTGRFMRWATREYHDQRVLITIAIERVIVDAVDLPPPPPSQEPPAKGTAARVSAKKYRSRWNKSTDVLLGYVDSAGFPMAHVVSATLDGDDVVVDDPALPEGSRRAGLLAHWFAPRLVGQGSVVSTGWLQVDAGGRARFSPHTVAGYDLPPSMFMFHLAGGLAAKFGYRKAVKQRQVVDGVWQTTAH